LQKIRTRKGLKPPNNFDLQPKSECHVDMIPAQKADYENQ